MYFNLSHFYKPFCIKLTFDSSFYLIAVFLTFTYICRRIFDCKARMNRRMIMEVDMNRPWQSHRSEVILIITLMMMNSYCQYNHFNLVTLMSATGRQSLGFHILIFIANSKQFMSSFIEEKGNFVELYFWGKQHPQTPKSARTAIGQPQILII